MVAAFAADGGGTGQNQPRCAGTAERLFRLQQVGKLFICEGQEVVSHSHLLVHRGGMPVHVATLDVHEQMLLRSFLRIQYTAWLELCELCNSVLSFYQGNYVWQGNVLELLELGDALWVTGRVSPQDGEKSKRQYLRRLLALFRFPVPDQPCRRLGELTGRVRPDTFVTWLHQNTGITGTNANAETVRFCLFPPVSFLRYVNFLPDVDVHPTVDQCLVKNFVFSPSSGQEYGAEPAALPYLSLHENHPGRFSDSLKTKCYEITLKLNR